MTLHYILFLTSFSQNKFHRQNDNTFGPFGHVWNIFPDIVQTSLIILSPMADGEQSEGSARRDRPSRREAAAGANGLPVFCRSRHFNRSANVYSVPLWDFTSRWLPDELKPYETKGGARGTFAPEKRSEGKLKDENEKEVEGDEDDDDDDEGISPDAPSDSEQSEIAWEGPLGGASRAWFRGAVDTALVLLRRFQMTGTEGASGASGSTYAMGVSAALIAPETVAEGADSSMDKRLAQIIRTREPQWAVCALRSGHFAGAIFKGQEAVVHKAIHRYTVRAKAGGAQSACDSGKKVKSVGSSLRRYGEQRLAEEIKELLTEKWADQLAQCELILVSVSKRMKSTLLGTEKEPFLPATHRIRKLPFMIGKPTFEAVQAAYLRAASVVFCEEKVADQIAARFKPAKVEEAVEAQPAPAPKVKQVEEVPEAVKYSEEEDPLFTALHVASQSDDVDAILEELENGANPEARDGKGRVPYYLCTTQAAREAFRRWRGANEDAWDWTAAQVPEGITQETEQRKKDKEKEKRKKQKEKQKVNKAKAKEEEEERLRKDGEEKKMLEEAQAKCDKCNKPLVAKPFARLNYLYCSPECVNEHRRDLQAEAALKRIGA